MLAFSGLIGIINKIVVNKTSVINGISLALNWASDIRYREYAWMSPSISELTPILFNTGITYLGSEASICSSIIITLLEIIHNFTVYLSVKLQYKNRCQS